MAGRRAGTLTGGPTEGEIPCFALASPRQQAMLGGMNHKRCCLVAATILQLTAAVRVRAEMPPIPEKAERALAALSRRPAPGPLFDRFLEAWLESSDLASLESLLRTRLATDSTAASDLLLGIFLLRDGRDEEALGHLRSATEKAPELTDAWLSRATAEQRLRNPDAAIASLTKARSSTAADSPQALRAGELLGRLLCRTGRTDEAIALWKEMTAQRPDDTALREDLAELQTDEGLFNEALATASQLQARLTEPYPQLRNRLRIGDIHAKAGQTDKAVATWLQCLGETAVSSWLEKEILSQISQHFRRQNNLAGLRQLLASKLADRPLRPALHRACAAIMAESGDRDEAIATLRQLADLMPGDLTVREECASLLREAGRPAEALALIDSLRTQQPDNPELTIRLALLRRETGDDTGFRALLDEFVSRSSTAESALLRRAHLLAEAGDPAAAADSLAAASATVSPDAPLALARADHLAKAKRVPEALALWKQAAVSASPVLILQIANKVTATAGMTEAFALLTDAIARQPKPDFILLQRLAETAPSADRSREALPFLRPLLASARTTAEQLKAINHALVVVRSAQATESLRSQLAAPDASPAEQCLLARLLEADGQTNAAEQMLRALPRESAAPFLVALLTRQERWNEAATVQESIASLPGPPRTEDARLLTQLLLRAGQSEKAETAARRWAQLAPTSPQPVLALADILSSRNDSAAALQILRTAAGRFKDHEEIRIRLATAASRSGNLPEALRYYQSLYDSARDSPARSRWLTAWAQTAVTHGSLPELTDEFRDRRRRSEDPVDDLLALAELHRLAANFEGRRAALIEAAGLAGDRPETALAIAELHLRENNRDAAIAALEPALAHDAAGLVREKLARLFLDSGRRDDGLALLRASAAEADPAALEQFAMALLRSRRAAEALAVLQSRPDATALDYRLGFLSALLLIETGQPTEAAALFTSLTTTTTELPEERRRRIAKKFQPPTAADELNGLLAARLPGKAADLFTTLSIRDALLEPEGQSINASFPLPSSLDDLHAAALAGACLSLSREPSESKRTQLITSLASAGYPWIATASLIPRIDYPVAGAPPIDWAALAATDQQNLDLLAIAAPAAAFDQTKPPSAALAARAWETFHASHPDFALAVCLPAIATPAEPAPWKTEVLAAAAAVESPDALLVYAATRRRTPANRAAAITEQFEDILFAWQQHLKLPPAIHDELNDDFLSALVWSAVRRNDPARLAAILAREFSPRGLPQTYHAPSLTVPLVFPPEQLPGVPPSVLFLCSEPAGFFPDGPAIRPEFLAAAAGHTTLPILRALLHLPLRDDNAQQQAFDQLYEAAGSDPAALLLAAAWYGERSDRPREADCLQRTLALTLAPEFRFTANAALASLGAQQDVPADLRKAAQEAALQLRSSSRSPAQRDELANLLASLGLTEEAARLSPRAARIRQIQLASPGHIDVLMSAGKRPEAVSAIAAAGLSLTAGSTAPDSWYPLWNAVVPWIDSISRHDIHKEVADAIAKAPDHAPVSRGFLLFLLGFREEAAPWLAQVPPGDTPESIAARAASFWIALQQQQASQAVELFQSLPAAAQQRTWNFPLASDASIKSTLREVFSSLLAAWPINEPAPWFENYLAVLCQEMPPGPQTAELVARACRVPNLAAGSLSLLLRLPPQDRDPFLRTAAINACLAVTHAPTTQRPPRTGWTDTALEITESCYHTESPAFIAIRESWRSGSLGELGNVLTSQLTDPPTAATAASLIQLYSSPADSFADACRQFLATAADPESAWSQIAIASADRQLTPDLSAALDAALAPLQEPVTEWPALYSASAALAASAALQGMAHGPDAVTAFLRRMADRCLGPEDGRSNRLASLPLHSVPPSSLRLTPKEAGPLAFIAAVRLCCASSPPCVIPALTVLHDTLAAPPATTQEACLFAKRCLTGKSDLPFPAATTLERLRRAGLLGNDFVRPLGPFGGIWNLPPASDLPFSAGPWPALATALAAEPPSYGRDLLLAFLHETSTATTEIINTVGSLSRQVPAITLEWSRSLATITPESATPALSNDGKAFLAAIAADQSAEARRLFTEARTALSAFVANPSKPPGGDPEALLRNILHVPSDAPAESRRESLALALATAAITPSEPLLNDAFDPLFPHPANPEAAFAVLQPCAALAATPGPHFPLQLPPGFVTATLTSRSTDPATRLRWKFPLPPEIESMAGKGARLALLPGALAFVIPPPERDAFRSWFTGGLPWEDVLGDPSISSACRLSAALAICSSPFGSDSLAATARALFLSHAKNSEGQLPFPWDDALSLLALGSRFPVPETTARELLPVLTSLVADESHGSENHFPFLTQLAIAAGESGRALALIRKAQPEYKAFHIAMAVAARREDLLTAATASPMFLHAPADAVPDLPADLLSPASLAWLATHLPDPAVRWNLTVLWAAAALRSNHPGAGEILVSLAASWPQDASLSPGDKATALALLAEWPPALAALPPDALPTRPPTPWKEINHENLSGHLTDIAHHLALITRGQSPLGSITPECMAYLNPSRSLADPSLPILRTIVHSFPSLPRDEQKEFLRKWQSVASSEYPVLATASALLELLHHPAEPPAPLPAASFSPTPFPFPLPAETDRNTFLNNLSLLLQHQDPSLTNPWSESISTAAPAKPTATTGPDAAIPAAR